MTRRGMTIGAAGRVVADNIARLRRAQRLTYVELSARMTKADRPIPVLGLRRVEKHQRHVDVDDLLAFASVLGVSVSDLLTQDAGCQTCRGTAPSGFRCLTCGAEGGGG